MIYRLRVTTKSDDIRNEVVWEGKDHQEARRQLAEAKKVHDYAHIMMEDE